jgi:tetratricopeptide (TPR) repeat protein
MDPTTPGLASLERRLATPRTSRRTEAVQPSAQDHGATPSTPTPPALTPERRKEVEALYRRGVQAMEEGRTADAVQYWELVWSFDPDHERVQEHLKREYMTLGLEQYARGALEAAIDEWQKALQVDPTDPRALAYLQRAREQLSRSRQILGPGE